MSLATLRAKTRIHLDDTNSANYRYTSTNIDSIINDAYLYYYLMAVEAKYEGLLSAPAPLNIVSSTETIALPSDFLIGWKVSRVIDGKRVPLTNKRNYDNIKYTTGGLGSGFYYPNYEFRGTNLVLDPTPTESVTSGIYLEYWPSATLMTGDTDDVAAGFKQEWEPAIPLLAAKTLKAGKEEEDTSGIDSLLMKAERPIFKALGLMTSARKRTERFII